MATDEGLSSFIHLGVVRNRQDEILAVKRRNPEVKGGGTLLWAFPGGRQKFNESREDCVKRTVASETGYVVKPIRQISIRVHPQLGVPICYHLCEPATTERAQEPAEGHEIIEIRWVPKIELQQLFTSDLDPGVARILGI